MLAAVLQTNLFLSLIIFYPIMLALIGLKWERLGFVDRSWYMSIVCTFAVLEAPRLYLGIGGNKNRSVSSLIGFIALTLTTHLAIMGVYNAMVPQKTSLDYAVSVVELILGIIEVIMALVETRKLVRQNTVNFYVNLGADL